ncbi:MAG: biopolymer transporter ExbD [Verrucomicrobiota bacterium]|nr:biopolymer transporter ExbD [Verrucomicrobiota bacterium]
MKRRLSGSNEQTEINVSPLIDMVFILLIFFIVATSFVNEIGISSTYKDSASPNSSILEPLTFDLTSSGQILQNGKPVSLEEIAPIIVRTNSESSDKVTVRVESGSRAGLATKVMDQAMRGGASTVKLTPLSP